MAERRKAADTAAEEVKEETVKEETAKEETVTISKADFDSLLADMKLMKQQLASEDREKSASAKQREKEEAMIAQTEAANARAMEEVDYYVDLGSLRSNKNIEVSINGKQYIVPRGKQVRIPRCVKEVIENSLRQKEESLGLQDRKKADFEKAEATGRLTL